METQFTVATYNLHGGVDAWGRPFDAVSAVRDLGADVVLLQETWTPEDGVGMAAEIAAAIGGTAHEVMMASGRRAEPHPDASKTWHRRRSFIDGDHALYLESERPLQEPLASSDRYGSATPGSFGLAVVSRLPVRSSSVIEFGRLRRDRARRAVVVANLDVGGTPVTVVATHMSHLTHGSPLHFRRLRQVLRELTIADHRIVLGGDMNLWGPLVSLQLPGLRRAVKGATWPSWGPHSQLDHLLVGRGLTVLGGRVGNIPWSDPLPVIARLRPR